MSEELRQSGYLTDRGCLGDPLGDYESFSLGASTLSQLARAGVIAGDAYGPLSTLKPDGLVVDRRDHTPVVQLIVEYKDIGELDTESKREAVFKKVAETYCKALDCRLAAVTDGVASYWLVVTPLTSEWKIIQREDGYAFDVKVDLATDDGRATIKDALGKLRQTLNFPSGRIVPFEAVNPTRLAEQTWQTIWLASGEDPERCLATFVEILIFKFLSDLDILTTSPSGTPVDFATVASKNASQILRYYFDHVRPEIKRLFPPGQDGTSVINGIVMDPSNVDHGRLFHRILKEFREAGELRRIDPEFKSRIFERFLKKSISKKNWGQYFTPRNVVKAMVEMSDIDRLTPNAVVADPACGVGGFLLEPLVNRRLYDFRSSSSPSLDYRGWDRDPKTIILAKANMLIHLSEVLESDPGGAPAFLGPVLNQTFNSTAASITGSLANAPTDEFDLVMTNPPYVVAGTSTQRAMIAEDAALSAYYAIGGSGVENLFLQLIINGLKPGARALVILPDGLLLRHTEEPLRRHLLKTCQLEAIVSLPKDTFYSTPKKTYIVVFRKKFDSSVTQIDPVFSYLVKEVGETRDAKRFPIDDNDLPAMVQAFRQFQAAPNAYSQDDDLQLKVWPIGAFKPEEHWLVDRWWTEEERKAIGVFEGQETISAPDLAARLREAADTLEDLAGVAENQEHLEPVEDVRHVALSNSSLFRLSIGKRVLKKELFNLPKGPIPLYSANVVEPFGHVQDSNLDDFSNPSVLWGIDGDFELSVKERGVEFAITDHCGRIEILDNSLDASYCRAAITLARVHGFDRTLRPSLQRMKKLAFPVPVDSSGQFDLEAQKAMASRFDLIVETLREASSAFHALADLEPEVLLPGSTPMDQSEGA